MADFVRDPAREAGKAFEFASEGLKEFFEMAMGKKQEISR